MEPAKLFELLESVLNTMGYELVDLDYREHPSNGLLRLYIDQPEGVSLADCERVSDQVSGVLDVEDPIPGHYTLEVSSPGARRVLRTAAHFEHFAGSRVKVELSRLHGGRRRFTGKLLGFEEEEIVMEVDGAEVRLPMAAVDTARLAPQL